MLFLFQVSKSFPSSFDPILKNLTLDLKKGDFCVLIGSNGSGKSTLLKTITGEYGVDFGKIILNQEDITKQSLSSRSKFISSVTQDIIQGTVGEMTLLENLVLSSLRGKKSTLSFYASEEERLLKPMEQLGLGLEKYIYTPLGHLSGGQRQMIATLMALFSKPNLLLLDEHTSALDPKTQKTLMGYTDQKIQEYGITSLMVTHNLEDALSYGNRLIMMHKGQIILDAKGEDKKSLTLQKLKNLFYLCEDDLLLKKEEGI